MRLGPIPTTCGGSRLPSGSPRLINLDSSSCWDARWDVSDVSQIDLVSLRTGCHVPEFRRPSAILFVLLPSAGARETLAPHATFRAAMDLRTRAATKVV